jgi:hypothetical protein
VRDILHGPRADGECLHRLLAEPSSPTPSTEFLEEGGWTDVNELGIVYKEGTLAEGGGANLRASPGGKLIRWLPQNTKVFILKQRTDTVNAYAVTVLKPDGSSGGLGYIATTHVWRNLPDPDAEVVKIKPGQSPIGIASAVYSPRGFNVSGKDARYVVNTLVWVNRQARHNAPGEAGIDKEAVNQAWYTAKSVANVYVWLPGVDFLNSIYEQVARYGGGTGSLSTDLWRGVKHEAFWRVAFVGGLVHGFVKSIWDAISGLVSTVFDLLYSIFSGNVLSDAEELCEALSKVTWEQIKEMVGAWADEWTLKLISSDPWTAGHAHGYLTGYFIAELAQLLLTGGAMAAAKGALWTSRLGKLLKATRPVIAFEKGMKKVGAAKDVLTAGAKLAKSKVFTVLAEAKTWIGGALRLSGATLSDLTLAGINRLRLLSDDALHTLSRLAEPFKRVVLGCASPCKVDIEAIKKYIATTAGQTAKGKRIETVEDILAALKAQSKKINTDLIEKKLRKNEVRMTAISKAELTVDDIALIVELAPITLENAKTAYELFIGTLSTLIPGKVGNDVNKLNAISEAIVAMEPRFASAFKGPMFESFIRLHITEFHNAKRATWIDKTFAKSSRQCDALVVDKQAWVLWEFKHTVGKVPADQLEDYFQIMTRGLESVEGQKAKSVNFLFATKEGAQTNLSLIQSKGFNVFYITPPDVVTLLK